MEDDELVFYNPFETFKREILFDDLQVQIACSESLRNLATVLGEEQTREKLLPFLEEFLSENYVHDDILLRLAEELGLFVPLIGGAKNAHYLLSALEKLACAEDSFVRDHTVNSLLKIANVFNQERLETHFIPLVNRLTESDWFTSKSSAARLYSICYSKASEEQKSILRHQYRVLCQDESPMVRKYSAANLVDFVKVLEKDHLKNEFIPIFDNISKDEQDSVRVFAIDVGLAIAQRLTFQELEENILNTLLNLSSDLSWRVRFQFASKITNIQEILDPKITRTSLVDILKSLSKDVEPQIRELIAHNIIEFSFNLQRTYISSEDSTSAVDNLIIEEIIPIIQELDEDPVDKVAEELCTVLPSLSKLLGSNYSKEFLLPLITSKVNSESTRKQENLIINLNSLIAIIGIEVLAETVQQIMLELLNKSQLIWRTKRNLLVTLIHVAQYSSMGYFNKELKSIYVELLNDGVYAVRKTAPLILPLLAKRFGPTWTKEFLKESIFTLAESRNYMLRILCLDTLNELVAPYLNQASVMNTSDYLNEVKSTFLGEHEKLKMNAAKIAYVITTKIIDVQLDLDKDWVKTLSGLYPGESYYNDDVKFYGGEVVEDLQRDNSCKILAVDSTEIATGRGKSYLEGIFSILPEIIKVVNFLRCDKVENVKLKASRTIVKVIEFLQCIELETQATWVKDAIAAIPPDDEIFKLVKVRPRSARGSISSEKTNLKTSKDVEDSLKNRSNSLEEENLTKTSQFPKTAECTKKVECDEIVNCTKSVSSDQDNIICEIDNKLGAEGINKEVVGGTENKSFVKLEDNNKHEENILDEEHIQHESHAKNEEHSQNQEVFTDVKSHSEDELSPDKIDTEGNNNNEQIKTQEQIENLGKSENNFNPIDLACDVEMMTVNEVFEENEKKSITLLNAETITDMEVDIDEIKMDENDCTTEL